MPNNSFNPDQFLADTDPSKTKSSFDPDQFLKETTPKPSLLDKAKNFIGDTAKGFSAGVSEATPFGNAFDKGAAAAEAGTEALFDLFRKPENRKDFNTRYEQNLKGIQNQRAQEIETAPIAAKAGDLLGKVQVLAAPIPGVGMEGLGGVATRIGANAALGALDAGTSDKDKTFDLDKAKQGATLGAIAGTTGEALGALAKPAATVAANAAEKVTGPVSDFLDQYAGGRALKAAFGNVKKAYDQIGGTDSQKAKAIGNTLLQQSPEGAPVVGFGNTVATIADKADAAKNKTWNQINAIHELADSEGIGVNGEDIASNILNKASKIKDVPQNKGLINSLQEQALFYEQKGQIPLSELQDIKNQYVWKMPTGNAAKDLLGKDGNNAVRSAISDAMKDTVKSSGLPGTENYDNLLNKYGHYASAADAAQTMATREGKNRSISLTDYIAGAAGGTAAAAMGDDKKDAALAGGLFALGNHLGRTRGNAALAVIANKLANAVEQNPDLIRRFGSALESALKNGGATFAATNAILMNDPEYRSIVSEPNAFQRRLQNGGNP